MTGLDGGFNQTITCQYRTGSEGYRDATSSQYELGFLSTVEFLVSEDLQPVTAYSIRLISDNEYPDGRATESDVITVTTRGKQRRCTFFLLW